MNLLFLFQQSFKFFVGTEVRINAVVLHIVSALGELSHLSVEFGSITGDDGVQHVFEVNLQMDTVARLHIQMLHVRLDAYFAHFGMKHETEVEAVVVGNVGGVGHFSFSEERELQNDFIDMRIEIPVLDFARDDDFALWGRRWFLSLPGVASEEQKQGKDEDG